MVSISVGSQPFYTFCLLQALCKSTCDRNLATDQICCTPIYIKTSNFHDLVSIRKMFLTLQSSLLCIFEQIQVKWPLKCTFYPRNNTVQFFFGKVVPHFTQKLLVFMTRFLLEKCSPHFKLWRYAIPEKSIKFAP